jgi:3-methyladenine DNA glycosylase/8-oxoguanine DNA glycosylase
MTSSPISPKRSTPPDPPTGAARTATGARLALLPLRFPIDLRLTVASHGWAHLAPWRWDETTGVLARDERIGNTVGTIAIVQRDPATIVVDIAGLPIDALPESLRRAGRWLSADWDPSAALAALGDDGALIRRGGGRLLRCSSFFEDFVKTVLTINTAWSSTRRMTAALIAEPGGGTFPPPEAVLDYGEEQLRERARLGFRAATVTRATRRMIEDGVIDHDGEGWPDYDYLLGLHGIGPYAAAHCRLLLHDFSRIPVDTVVTSYLRDRHAVDPASFAASRARWGDYLALGYRLERLREKLAAAPTY